MDLSALPRLSEFPGYFCEIRNLYEQMDRAYAEAAAKTGFTCTGCDDNCCKTWFHHHTLCEILYLREGFYALDEESRKVAAVSARRVLDEKALQGASGEPFRAWCPLCSQGRCITYGNRPMICRLHGVSWQMTYPGGSLQKGPGCDVFEQNARTDQEARLDRTPFYRLLAETERGLRREMSHSGRISLTIAEIIALIDPA